jgi:hypothetical protein
MNGTSFDKVRFENQPAKGGQGVPAAIISASCRIPVETKIKRGTVDPEQLRRHLKRLDGKHETEILLVLNPDETKPSDLTSFASVKRVAWASFNSLTNAIDELLADERKVISEREPFQLRQLQASSSGRVFSPPSTTCLSLSENLNHVVQSRALRRPM